MQRDIGNLWVTAARKKFDGTATGMHTPTATLSWPYGHLAHSMRDQSHGLQTFAGRSLSFRFVNLAPVIRQLSMRSQVASSRPLLDAYVMYRTKRNMGKDAPSLKNVPAGRTYNSVVVLSTTLFLLRSLNTAFTVSLVLFFEHATWDWVGGGKRGVS